MYRSAYFIRVESAKVVTLVLVSVLDNLTLEKWGATFAEWMANIAATSYLSLEGNDILSSSYQYTFHWNLQKRLYGNLREVASIIPVGDKYSHRSCIRHSPVLIDSIAVHFVSTN